MIRIVCLILFVVPWSSAAESCLFADTFIGAAASSEDEPEKLDFQTLMDFEYEEGKELPKSIRDLDGKKVLLKGYMDTFTPENTRQFFMMSESCACNGEVKMNHFVDVSLTSQVTGYDPGLLTVVGTLSVGAVEEDGFVISIFQIEGSIQ